MASDKQFDILLGGSEHVPQNINFLKFASQRAKEIEDMKNTLLNPRNNKLIFQRLPVHMRRRVMSHNAKRLPRRLRQAHIEQLAKSANNGLPPSKKKRPSRKYRRRPSNLKSEYIRRQRRVNWLETHIWHAKRFHMIERWGYKLPDKPCDKAFRACYRASSQHCLLQDMSYVTCIELSGPSDILFEKLKMLVNNDTGLGFGAKAYINGCREGFVTLFYPNSFPYKAIGEVNFMWKQKPSNDNIRTVWIWAHAGYYQEVIEVLIQIFNLSKCDYYLYDKASDFDNISPSCKAEQNLMLPKLPVYNNSSADIQLVQLKNDLNRFRLTGPLSQAVLKNGFLLTNNQNMECSQWFQAYLAMEQNKQVCEVQNNFWKELEVSSPGELSPRLIVSLIINDPRLNHPSKRTKAMPVENENNVPDTVSELHQSPLWDFNVRSKVLIEKPTIAQINKLRSEQLVPGIENSNKYGACVPVILIQRPGDQQTHLGYGSGWDLIVPNGWGSSVWENMIMWGARAGGLRENRISVLESRCGDILKPDTKSGQLEETRIASAHTEKYFKLPPNKRVNYIKLGIVAPFHCPWQILIKEWMANENKDFDEFYVLRNKKILTMLKDSLLNKTQSSQIEIDFNEPALVPVKLKVLKKGLIKDHAIICLPVNGDQNVEPFESKHDDPNIEERKQLRKDHISFLKRLKQKRLRAKRKKQEDKSQVNVSINCAAGVIKQQAETMRRLWIPSVETIRNSCSRPVAGYVTHGDFSLCEAKGCAVGYIALGAFRNLTNKILIRNTTSRQYRTTNIDIIV